ncbi:hypothetical protein QFC21_001680 [Naganishia friedmannii]|uniref:Uncharacterized protein n=1 Tax=Naganishia friedmannii TaxID=89922 RepID=A0ACC2W2I8_9TREE|nr:hypothetical protein QFC21_001680 [Naganishia friedmannii]
MSASSPSPDPWKSHKAKASSLSVLWNPIKRGPPGGGAAGAGEQEMQSEIRYISSPIHSLDGSGSGSGSGNSNGNAFVFPVQDQKLSRSILDAMHAGALVNPEEQRTVTSPSRTRVTAQHQYPSLASPSASDKEKKRPYSLRNIFLHRKSNSTHSPASARFNGNGNDSHNTPPPPMLSPSISAPWGLTVASFRPAPVPHHQHHHRPSDSVETVPPDLRHLRLEDTILVSRESDSNGLLAQQRARDMPVPLAAAFPGSPGSGKSVVLARSTSLGNPLMSMMPPTTTAMAMATSLRTPERPKRYEAPTLCEKFIIPRPRLVAHEITPPASPFTHSSPAAPPPPPPPVRSQQQQQETPMSDSYAEQPEVARIGRRSALFVFEEQQHQQQQQQQRAGSPAMSALSGARVLQEGKERDWEREEWAAKARAAGAARVSSGRGGGGGGAGAGLRMRLASTMRDEESGRDGRYAQARFAPMPVAYERVQGGVREELRDDGGDDGGGGGGARWPLVGRKKSRSGSLGDLLAGPFLRRDRVAAGNERTASDHSERRLLEPVVRTTSSSRQQQYRHRQRRASEPSLLATPPAATTTTTTFTFLRQLTQSPRGKARHLQHARTPSLSGMERNPSSPAASTSGPAPLPMMMALDMDKPLPPEPVGSDQSDDEERKSRKARYSASSPDLRNFGLTDLPVVSPLAQGGSRNSALNLLTRSDVVDRLAHPVREDHAAGLPFSARRSPPLPIQVVSDSVEEMGASRATTARIMQQEEDDGEEPFTPTRRQAAWDQWHTSTLQLRSPGSPLPERLPAETVRKLAERQAKSPRQKKPSMEEAVNRARIAKQLFGDLPSSPPLLPLLPAPHSPSNDGYEHSHVGSTSPTVATTASWQHDRLLYAAFTGNHSPQSFRRYGEATGSPQRTRLAPPTPGSTEASPMPGASFEDIERDLFFSRPRRLWGTPVALPSRNGDDHTRIVNGGAAAAAEIRVEHASRQSKDFPEPFSSPSTTRIVSTSDESSHDAHGTVEVATPNFSHNDGHHDKARFPAISEEEGRSNTSDSDDRALRGDENQPFHDHRWLQKGLLPRTASSNTILNFYKVEARQPEEPRLAINAMNAPGKTSLTPDRSSVVPESGQLDESSDGEDSTRSLALISKNGHKGFPAVPSTAPTVGRNDSAYSSVSDINSFVSARSTATIKPLAEHAHPAFPRQDTDLTTMSYATAESQAL